MTSLPGDLRSRAARGAALTLVVQVLRIGIQLGALVVLARLIEPSVFGVMAIVLVVIGVGETLRELGLASASIHAEVITRQQQSNLFWINVAIGVLLAALCVGGATALETLYGTDGLAAALAVTSSVFVLNGLASQHRARLARSLRFSVLAVSELVSVVAGLAAAMIAASAGATLGALVIQQITQAALLLVLSLGASRWLPGLPRRCDMADLFRYGGWLSVTQLINYGARNLDTLVLGKVVSTTTLGYYNRAFQLVMLPVTQINAPALKVAFPILARMQDDPARFGRYLRAGHTALVHSVVPLLLAAVAVCDPFIELVLGREWAPTANLFMILALSGVFQAASYSYYWTFLATGRTSSNFRFTLLTKSILVVAILVGTRWGAEGVASGVALSSAVGWLIGIVWLSRMADVAPSTWWVPTVTALSVYVPATAVSYGAGRWAFPDDDILRLVVVAVVFAAVCAVSSRINRPFGRDVALLRTVATSIRKVDA